MAQSFQQFQQQMALIEQVQSGILAEAEKEERALDAKLKAMEELGKPFQRSFLDCNLL